MNRIDKFLSDCCAKRVFPGAVYAIGSSDGILQKGHVGTLAWREDEVDAQFAPSVTGIAADPVTPDTLYDLASVTKTIVALGMMRLFESGLCRLDDTIAYFLPEYKGTDKADLTIRQLLKHSSGVPGQQPIYKRCKDLEDIKHAVRTLPIRYPADTQVEYTSQGFMIVGWIMEAITGQTLDQTVQTEVAEPLGIEDLHFNPPESLHSRIAATEYCGWRNRMVRGEVHDENAVVMGGVGGHAGLFGTAPDLAKICIAMLRRGQADNGQYSGQYHQFLSPETVELMGSNHTAHLNLARGLGWQGKDQSHSPAGDLFSDASYGHTGFTGTSIWMDPARDRFAVLLSNRVHPTRENDAMPRVRAIFHNLVVASGI